MTRTAFPARVSLHVDDRVLPAEPVHLDGHVATVVVDAGRLEGKSVRLFVDWFRGGCTELTGTVRSLVDGDARTLAQLDFDGVAGDWQPFLTYLGSQASA